MQLYPITHLNIIEVEREDRALSTLICCLGKKQNKSYYYQLILRGLINSHGAWDRNQLQVHDINFSTLKHGKKDVEHRARRFNKLFYKRKYV